MKNSNKLVTRLRLFLKISLLVILSIPFGAQAQGKVDRFIEGAQKTTRSVTQGATAGVGALLGKEVGGTRGAVNGAKLGWKAGGKADDGAKKAGNYIGNKFEDANLKHGWTQNARNVKEIDRDTARKEQQLKEQRAARAQQQQSKRQK